jgi:hypothetical protein
LIAGGGTWTLEELVLASEKFEENAAANAQGG